LRYACVMSTTAIHIRDIPVEVRERLAAQAAAEGQSMQAFLRRRLIEWADHITMKEWIERTEGVAYRVDLSEIDFGAIIEDDRR
jgi:plasmid stability protein